MYQGVASIQFFAQAEGTNCTDNTVQCSHRFHKDTQVHIDPRGSGSGSGTKWNSRELDSRGEEKASGQCGARRSQAEDRTPTQKLSALQNAHRKPDKVPCAFWDVRMVLRISHRCACMCVRACTRAQMGVCVLVYLHMYLSTRVHDYPVCMGLYVRVCTCVHVRMHVHARVFMHVCILLCLRAMRTCGYARMRDHVLMCMSALRYASL